MPLLQSTPTFEGSFFACPQSHRPISLSLAMPSSVHFSNIRFCFCFSFSTCMFSRECSAKTCWCCTSAGLSTSVHVCAKGRIQNKRGYADAAQCCCNRKLRAKYWYMHVSSQQQQLKQVVVFPPSLVTHLDGLLAADRESVFVIALSHIRESETDCMPPFLEVTPRKRISAWHTNSNAQKKYIHTYNIREKG